MLPWIVSVSCTIIFIAQCDAITDDEILENFYPDDIETEFATKCFGDLGCFYSGPPFYDPVQRPVSVPPADDTDAKFYLFTPDNPKEKYVLVPTTDSLNKSRFNEGYPLKVLIHGTAQEKLSIFYKMKDELLKEGNYNVIVVDWRRSSGFPVWQSFANARLVAAMVAKLLNFLLNESCLESHDIHIIAHSLGAQLAGLVGERIDKLGRISGLDPSGPTIHGAPPIVRLDYSDAIFVDVLHTNSGLNVFEGLSLIESIGQVNFYPNGGQKQPGCTSSNQSNETFAEFMDSCNHNRAVELYIATINSSKCQYLAVECDSWEKFKEGACQPCNSTINKMGFHAKYIPGVPYGSKFYLKTGAKYPFFKGHNLINIFKRFI